MHGTNMKII